MSNFVIDYLWRQINRVHVSTGNLLLYQIDTPNTVLLDHCNLKFSLMLLIKISIFAFGVLKIACSQINTAFVFCVTL